MHELPGQSGSSGPSSGALWPDDSPRAWDDNHLHLRIRWYERLAHDAASSVSKTAEWLARSPRVAPGNPWRTGPHWCTVGHPLRVYTAQGLLALRPDYQALVNERTRRILAKHMTNMEAPWQSRA